MPREYRRVLGRHSSSVKDSDSVYARELSFAPVRAMERMFNLIRKSEFNPDAPRSKFLPEAPEPGAAPVFPPTPAFHASVAAPSTPAEKLAHQPLVEPSFSNEAPLEVKQEDELILKTPSEQKEVSDLVEAISSSEDESDSSGAESGLSSTDDDIQKLSKSKARSSRSLILKVSLQASMKCGCSMCISKRFTSWKQGLGPLQLPSVGGSAPIRWQVLQS